jgi:Tol biopolymer transport system component
VVTNSSGEGKPDALFVISRETAETRQLTSPPAPLLGDSNPAVSPDGRWLVFRRVPAASAGELYALPLGTGLTIGGEPTRLTSAALDAAYPTWMPDSNEILFSGRRSLWRLAIAAERPPIRLPFVGEDGLMPAIARSHPGRPVRLVYVRTFSDWNIWRVDTSTPGALALSPPVGAISSTREEILGDFSPDGRRVVFASNRSGSFEIWLADPDGSNAVQLTSMGAPMTAAPRWSRDGGLIAFQSSIEGQFEIYTIPAAGGKPRRITSHPGNDHVPSFSRDGHWIYFSSTRTGDYQIWKVPASSGEAVQVTDSGGFLALERPDGADLFYTQAPGGPTALWRIAASGGRPVKVLEKVLDSSDSFAVVEAGIYYIDRFSGQTRLKFYDFTTRSSTTVARNLGDVRALLAASPDGRTILYTRVDSSVDDLMLVENFR